MNICKNCFGSFNEAELMKVAKDRYNSPVFVCKDCKEIIKKEGHVYLDETCSLCSLTWHGFYRLNRGLNNHSEWDCRRIQTHTINPDKPYGEHIDLKCSKCGMTGWNTKNIDCVGERTIFFDLYEKGLKECDCEAPLIPIRNGDKK